MGNDLDALDLEFKILASAIMLGEDERRKIFALSQKCFTKGEVRDTFVKLKKIFEKYPSANEGVYLAALDNEIKKTILLKAQEAISPLLMSNQLESTIEAFKELVRNADFKSKLNSITIGSDITYREVKALVDEFEPKEDGVKDNAVLYLQNYRKKYEVIPTGFEVMDKLLNGGFIKGTIATIGARPSTGKTTFAINIASHNRQIKTLFFSLEMSAVMIYDRIMADYLNESYTKTGKHDEIEITDVTDMLEHYENLKIIDDVSDIEDITEMIYQKKPDFVIIDFVQIVSSMQNFIDNRQRIDYISQQLKRAAKKINCCILVLSQLTRNAKEKPTMSALKESGGLEQDSDYILLLHRDYVNDKSNDDIKASDTDVILDKNKFGRTMELKFDFDGEHQRFTEIGTADSDKSEPVAHMTKEGEAEDDDLPF